METFGTGPMFKTCGNDLTDTFRTGPDRATVGAWTFLETMGSTEKLRMNEIKKRTKCVECGKMAIGTKKNLYLWKRWNDCENEDFEGMINFLT